MFKEPKQQRRRRRRCDLGKESQEGEETRRTELSRNQNKGEGGTFKESKQRRRRNFQGIKTTIRQYLLKKKPKKEKSFAAAELMDSDLLEGKLITTFPTCVNVLN